MTLAEYLETNSLTATAFAGQIDRAISTITRICKGTIHPDKETMQAIVDATGGAVTPNDFFVVPDSPSLPSPSTAPLSPPEGQ